MIKNKMRIIVSLVAVLFSISYSHGVTRAIINEESYVVDTLQHYKTGPGTTFTEMRFSGEKNSHIFKSFFIVSDVENNPYMKFRVETANDSIKGLKTISEHIRERAKPGEYYIAGVNGDLQPAGAKNWGCNQNGVYATPPPPGSAHLVITDERTPWCTTMSNSVTLKINETAIPVDHINDDRFTNELVIYNRMNGGYTHTEAGGKEIAFELLDGEIWKINSVVKGKVKGAASTTGNMVIPALGGVISASGTAISKIDDLKEGDIIEVKITQELQFYDNITPNITQTVGSFHSIVRDGKVSPVADYARHPRTLVGYSKDQKQLIMCVVDGRQVTSAGVTYAEMSDLMVYAGAYGALNFDGGGSSAMYTNSFGIMNSPSDGTERPVWSGLYLVLNAPEDNVIASIAPKDWKMMLPEYGIYKPVFCGYNKYGMLIDKDVQGVELSCPSALGEIKDNNTFIGNQIGTGVLTGTYNGMTATIPVTVQENCELKLRLNDIVNNGYRDYPVEVQSDVNGITVPVSSSALEWSTDDSSIASVDQDGIVKGISDGVTKVYGTLRDFIGELTVNVEKPIARTMPIEKDMDVSTWKITQVGGKNREVTPYENGMRITYTGASGRGYNIRLAKKIKLWSLPDSLYIKVNPGDATIVYVNLSISVNGVHTLIQTVGFPVSNSMRVIRFPTNEWGGLDDFTNSSVYFNYIQFDMFAPTVGKEYVIDIPAIETVYTDVPLSGVEENLIDGSVSVNPNPVKAGENITISGIGSGELSLKVYNISGQEVKGVILTPENGKAVLSTSGLTSGIYVITISQEGISYSSKLIVE